MAGKENEPLTTGGTWEQPVGRQTKSGLVTPFTR